ncbi:MAG: glycoside hydrolase family 9 protein [Lachnospiraceae bacterium]|nr:glycoside hydrolase family 9 protein [Lachnospiraceae bacterium]
MEKSRWIQRIGAAAVAAVLSFSAVSAPISALAGEQLGETDFEEGKGLPWHIVESGPGVMDFEITGGKYVITIVNPGGASRGGEDRWDCQFRHRGLKIVAGHQYQVQYEITPSNAGRYYTKIGNLEGNVEIWHNMSNGYDLDSTWDLIPIGANETKKVSLTFTANQSMDVAEWAFHLGGDGQYTQGDCFPAGTVITFDNMSLVDLTSDENDYVPETPWERSGVLTNQLGYFTGAAKKATLISADGSGVKFEVKDQNGNSVFNGTSVPLGVDTDSGDTVHVIDFTALDTAGTYHIEAANGAGSRDFAVGDDRIYSAMLYDALNYFYQNRSGIAIESSYITSGDAASLARAAGHVPDNATIEQTWGYSGSSGSQEVTGGWYDAGDHGKYVVNGGISLWMLQNQYEMSEWTGTDAAYADGTMNIPENNNGYPDLLDEARWEMEWMFTMLVQDGEYKDMVYHKVHDEKWTGLGLAPAEDTMNRIIKPPTTAATLNVAACAAQAARLWKGIDDAFAADCLDLAKRTYAAAKAHPEMYAPLDESVGGGAYGDDDVSDEFYWAASELYISTGEDAYYQDMKASADFLKMPVSLNGGESVGAYGSFDWGHTAALGTLSICANKAAVSEADHKTAAENVKAAADAYIAKEEAQGYGQPYAVSQLAYNDSDSGYIWGSNSMVAGNAIVIAYGYLLSGDQKYYNGAVSGMDYLLGRNPMDYSYVTGYGTHTAAYPHHRYWANLIDTAYPLAPCGVLVGGPNSGMQDPWVRGSGWKKGTISPAKCYLDHIEAWSVNECTINWNAPLAWLTGFLVQYSSDGIIVGSTGNGSGLSINSQHTANTAAGGSDMTAGAQTAVQPAENSGGSSAAAAQVSAQQPAESTQQAPAAAGGSSNVLVIVGIIAGVVLVLAIAMMIFIYNMTKLKMQGNTSGNTEQKKDTENTRADK